MNYQEYRDFKSDLDLDYFSRLDCMNPRKALEFLKPPRRITSESKSIESIKEALDYNGTLSLSQGVRATLPTLIDSHKNRTFYIPQEVYPVYFQLASDVAHKGYSIFNAYALEDIHDSVVLYTTNHFGLLELDFDDAAKLINDGNILLIDAVYDYTSVVKRYYPLLSTGSCYIMGSTSKTQLLTDFGFVLHETSIDFEQPNACYEYDKDFPLKQLDVINRRWSLLAEGYGSIGINFTKTDHPYFRLIREHTFDNLLRQFILGIPLSVFSGLDDGGHFVVASCLYEINQ